MVSGDKPDFYSIAEAAQLLKVSLSTIWRWIEAGKLPAYRVGEKRIRIKREDLGAIIAYLKTVPPVDNQVPRPDLKPLGRILVALGVFGEVAPAQLVDHRAPFNAAVAPAVNVEYRRYLVSIAGCTGCHGKDLSGGQPPEPGARFAPDLTPAGSLGAWSEEVFISVIRSGRGEFMPWESFAKMTDEELGAIWRYLQSLPARE